ncbi:hypothetical protein CGSMWGv1500E_01203 [Gardnerella vaginalis 1500E]|uniref:LPXTG-motif protein cell wall anchor domain protein n=1 Tax=Gardnerella vaginalis 1500E TaxID=698957 RepID=I4M2Q2_GARVA|nr:hypothetical protein [Gardnerella vaginalis]EIK83492.1 hypothetical protein CGSMWGv1500E_01203 [Gardnerella vaginalis 1500E]
MSDLHRGSRFLRFLRSIGAKTACARRAIVAFFVAAATILATFMIMPSASMGASSQGEPNQVQAQSQTNSGNAEPKTASSTGAGVKDGAKEANVAETRNPQTSSRPAGSDAGSAQNVDSTKQQQNNAVEGANKSLKDTAADKDAAKDAEKSAKKDESANKLLRKRRELDRAATDKVDLPPECKVLNKKSFKSCYEISYDFGTAATVDNGKTILIKRGSTITINPKFKIKLKGTNRKDATMPSGLWFKLEKSGRNPVPSWVNFEKTENGRIIKVKDTENETGFDDGSITLRPNGKWDYGSYEFKVFAYYKNKKEEIHAKISVKVDLSDEQKSNLNNDLSLSLYDFENAQDGTAVTDNKITIKPKSNASATGGSAAGSADNKDTYDPINKLFIGSKSTKKPGVIYHHMICHENGSNDDASYTVDTVNGLSLKDKKDSPSTNKQTQFKHMENQTRPSENADPYTVYEENDDTERSQSWISGTPEKAGTFECKVFAIKDVQYSYTGNIKIHPKTIDHFKDQISYADKKKNLFENPDSLISFTYVNVKYFVGEDIDVAYKSVTIEVKSNKKKLEVKDGDLKLNVYPFKSADAGASGSSSGASSASAALGDGDTVSVMKGMELKPFIEATSEADSTKQITLRMLCAKGEKPQGSSAGASSVVDAGSAVGAGTTGSESNAGATDKNGLAYSNWQSPEQLGFNFPEGNAQSTCNSKEGEQSCSLVGSATKFAATANASATFKPTETGDYQCYVYALKQDALDKFNAEVAKSDVKPNKISTAFAGLTANKDYAQLAINIHVSEDFTLPHTGGQSWNLQLGAVAAVMVSVLAAGFVASQTEACRKLLYERRRC